jgi:hypothetical protein
MLLRQAKIPALLMRVTESQVAAGRYFRRAAA